MSPEREAVLREQARTGMVDVASLPDALSLLDQERARVAQLEARNAKLLDLINRMGDLFKTALRKETADRLREDLKKELPFFEFLSGLGGVR